MMSDQDPHDHIADAVDVATLAEQIVTDLRYVVLATADAAGLPWASPVYFAHRGLEEFYWVSAPGSTHSHNISERPEVSLVAFDSRRAVGTGRGVYARGRAQPVPGSEIGAALDLYSLRSSADGAGDWDTERLGALGLHIYQAGTNEVSLLPGVGPDRRIPVPLPPAAGPFVPRAR